MRILKVVLLVSLVALMGACSCRTRAVGAGDNIGMAGEGGPLKDIHFAFDSSALDSTAKNTLSSNAAWLKDNSSAKVQVEGHCDERGTNEYNLALGNRRAKAAYDYLRSLGVEAGRMSNVSYGEELPLDPRHDEAAWARNRRAHFTVSK